jgi:UDP-galactopyranose mutase
MIQPNDYLCFSHLRWDFVFQRPQHLLSRLAKKARVFYVEEPTIGDSLGIQTSKRDENLTVVTPTVTKDLNETQQHDYQKEMIHQLMREHHIFDYGCWYYTPMALPFSSHLDPLIIIYDCMDELSHFKNAPKELLALERQLLQQADLVFTGGQSLFEAKAKLHPNIHPFPSSIDFDHFASARRLRREPADQKEIPHPRLGFYGVLDERMNLELVTQIAEARPQWNFIFLGPVAKIDVKTLPQRKNIHYLGMKKYSELPAYVAGWDLAFLPFAKNESTKYISPTKTPEFLAAGCPVISTSIRDVVRPYAKEKLVKIADTPQEFIVAAERSFIEEAQSRRERLRRVDQFLANNSWNKTFEKMENLISATLDRAPVSEENYREERQY